MNFKTLGVGEEILKAIDALGFEVPTTVQEKAIPKILEKQDLIVMAKTGSGKTGAFSIPVIQDIEANGEVQALMIAPTRELAVQVQKDVQTFSKFTKVKSMAVYGQHSMNVELEQFKKGHEIVVGTPGRVYHHIKERKLNTSKIKYLILDEADRMLDMGFIDQMMKIIKAMPKERVTLLFSATMPPEIQRICKSYMQSPETIEIESDTKTVDTIKQEYFRVQRNEKRTQLKNLIHANHPTRCMVFCNTRIEVDKVNEFLDKQGFVSAAIHGANTQSKRMRTIENFKKGKIQIMVATDVAARGIHIDDLELVINYDVPQDKDNYIHRIGRTGRAGNGGLALTLVTSEDIMTLYEIEEHVGAMIDEEDLPEQDQIDAGKLVCDEKWGAVKKEQLEKRKQQREHDKKNPKPHNKPKSHQNKPGQKHYGQRKPHAKPHQSKPGQKPHNRPSQTHGNHPPKVHHKPKVDHKAIEQTKHVKPKAEQNHVKQPVVETPKVQKPIEKPVKTQAKKKFSLRNLFRKK